MKPSSRRSLRYIFTALGALIAVFGAAIYIELLGWRISKPGIPLSGIWNKAFVLGVLRTSGGALLCGLLPFSIGAILPGTRDWSLSHPALLWSTGAGTFLIAMAALVMWAP